MLLTKSYIFSFFLGVSLLASGALVGDGITCDDPSPAWAMANILLVTGPGLLASCTLQDSPAVFGVCTFWSFLGLPLFALGLVALFLHQKTKVFMSNGKS